MRAPSQDGVLFCLDERASSRYHTLVSNEPEETAPTSAAQDANEYTCDTMSVAAFGAAKWEYGLITGPDRISRPLQPWLRLR